MRSGIPYMLCYIEDGLAVFAFGRFWGISRPGEGGKFEIRKPAYCLFGEIAKLL